MNEHIVERPVGGRILTPFFTLLLVIIFSGAVLVICRLFLGLGSVSAMNDGYAWGIWKPLNVVTFTGIGVGAYAMGLLTYVFNRWRYHSLLRSTVVVGAMAYTLGGTSVLIDLGRWWNLWVTFYPPLYNLNSVLLEVAICVMAYCGVLWIELTPPVLEHARRMKFKPISRMAQTGLPYVRKALPIIIAIALLLPTMHQSSLGGLYMITPTKLHPLWYTHWISGLFYHLPDHGLRLRCRRRKSDEHELSPQNGPAPPLKDGPGASHGHFGLFHDQTDRLGNVCKLGLILDFDFYSMLFIFESALFLIPVIIIARRKWRENRGLLFVAGSFMVIAGAVYRFDTYLIAYHQNTGWIYFPSLGELLFSACLAATGIAVYMVMIKLFPILSGVRENLKHHENSCWYGYLRKMTNEHYRNDRPCIPH